MICNAYQQLLKDHGATLEETSKSGQTPMICCSKVVVNVDAFKNCYVAPYRLPDIPKSCDAMC